MKMKLQFNFEKIKDIEKTLNKSIEEIISDVRLETLGLLISKGYVDEDGKVGCSMSVAGDKITEYLKESENGKQDLVLDIIDELCDEGFLTKSMKEATHKIVEETMNQVSKI